MTQPDRLANALGGAGVEAAVLSRADDVCYATGFAVPPPIEVGAAFASGPPSAIASAYGSTALLVADAYAARAEQMSRAERGSQAGAGRRRAQDLQAL